MEVASGQYLLAGGGGTEGWEGGVVWGLWRGGLVRKGEVATMV